MNQLSTMLQFWENSSSKKPLYAIVHAANSTQPEGYMIGWATSYLNARRRVYDLEGNYIFLRIQKMGKTINLEQSEKEDE